MENMWLCAFFWGGGGLVSYAHAAGVRSRARGWSEMRMVHSLRRWRCQSSDSVNNPAYLRPLREIFQVNISLAWLILQLEELLEVDICRGLRHPRIGLDWRGILALRRQCLLSLRLCEAF